MLQLFLFRAIRSFFMLGVEQKCQPQRLTDDEKHPKTVHEKWKFGPKYKWSKNLIFGILFLKVLFRAYKAFIFVQTFQWISSEFFLISDFLAESRKANKKKLAKKITRFTIQFCSKSSLILRTSTHLTLKTISSSNTTKNFLILQIFRKHLYCTISWRPRTTFLKHTESKCLYISLYLLKKMFVPET